MLETIQAKLVAATMLLLCILWFGAHERGIGAAAIQAKWDAQKSAQSVVAVDASEKARGQEQAQASSFAGIATDYIQVTNHVYPSIADALPAAVSSGSVRLRNDCPAAAHGAGVSTVAASSRAIDAAATQALAQRVADSIAAVRVGERSDARERQLAAQVIGLQALLEAERSGDK